MTKTRLALVGLLAFGSIQPAFAAPRASIDPKVATMAALDYCESASQLDCIESITVIDTDGGRYSAKRTFSPTGQSTDSYGQVVEDGSSDWNFTTKAGKEIAFTVDATLTTPAFVVSGSETGDTETGSPSDGTTAPSDAPAVDPKTLDTRTYDPRLRIAIAFIDATPGVPDKAFDRQVEIVVRTSWLKVVEADIPGSDSNFSQSAIPGGSKLVLRGARVVYYQEFVSRSQLTGETTRRIMGIDNFIFDLTHGFGETAKCADSGAIVMASNGVSMSFADLMDSSSMSFRLTGVKSTDSGTSNPGFLNVQVPFEWLSCRDSGNLLLYGEKFTSAFTYGDGSKSDGKESASVIVGNNALVMKFSNFVYAKTEIKVSTDEKAALAKKDEIAAAKAKAEAEAKAKAEAEAKAKADAEAAAKAVADAAKTTPSPTPTTKQATPAPVAKATTITCVKGKSTKKVTAINPKCPSGYKKK